MENNKSYVNKKTAKVQNYVSTKSQIKKLKPYIHIHMHYMPKVFFLLHIRKIMIIFDYKHAVFEYVFYSQSAQKL